ncbi:MAG: hypothetical protein M1818_000614 [Claussenomyces sp. TS43310]|nr:MAG: hypothetical protein M1818_000614 [Claussenomyces sp. TS43310]
MGNCCSRDKKAEAETEKPILRVLPKNPVEAEKMVDEQLAKAAKENEERRWVRVREEEARRKEDAKLRETFRQGAEDGFRKYQEGKKAKLAARDKAEALLDPAQQQELKRKREEKRAKKEEAHRNRRMIGSRTASDYGSNN